MGAKTRKHKTFQVHVQLGEVSSRDLGWGGGQAFCNREINRAAPQEEFSDDGRSKLVIISHVFDNSPEDSRLAKG